MCDELSVSLEWTVILITRAGSMHCIYLVLQLVDSAGQLSHLDVEVMKFCFRNPLDALLI